MNPFKQNPNDPERIPDVEALHAYLIETENAEPGKLSGLVPDLPNRRSICENFFNCNIWDVEPHLLDDLERAKRGQNKEDVAHVREMIRAASWASHGRTDAEICLSLAESIGLKNKDVISALKDFQCDDKTESAVEFIEREIQDAWEKIAKNTDDAAKARERLHALRPIRDQLYFQRLYKKLCAIGRAGR